MATVPLRQTVGLLRRLDWRHPWGLGLGLQFPTGVLTKAFSEFLASGVPYAVWTFCLMAFLFVYARSPGAGGAHSPYQLRFNRSYDLSKLRPFGSACYYLSEEHEKFASRGRLGVALGYSRLQSYYVLDFEHYVETKGEARIVHTRDVRFPPQVRWPYHELGMDNPMRRTGPNVCSNRRCCNQHPLLVMTAAVYFAACGPLMRTSIAADVYLAVVVVGMWMVPAAFVLVVVVIRSSTFSMVRPFRTRMNRAWTTPQALHAAVMGASSTPPWLRQVPGYRHHMMYTKK